MNSKHAIITGGSSGIGLAVAKNLADSGWKITLIARNEERLDRAISSLNIPADQTLSLATDVTDKTPPIGRNTDGSEGFASTEIGGLGTASTGSADRYTP